MGGKGWGAAADNNKIWRERGNKCVYNQSISWALLPSWGNCELSTQILRSVFAKREREKKREGAERHNSPRNREAESGREKPAGKFQSKRLYPSGSFSPWKINLHLILLRNCSSPKQMESMRLIFF